jgi:hypothetical protein
VDKVLLKGLREFQGDVKGKIEAVDALGEDVRMETQRDT